jgi:flagellar basal-body rod protein FlgF
VTYGIYVATSGAVALERQLDVVANNLANATTTGFKALEVSFEEVLADAEAPNRHLVDAGPTRVDPSAGPVQQTGNPLDLALEGPGFFVADAGGGQRVLLRSVAARVAADGRLRDPAGRALELREGGGLALDPARPVQIDPDGGVRQGGDVLGRLLTADVVLPAGLAPLSAGAYQVTPESGAAVEVDTRVISGALEGSNVQSVTSMVRLVRLERDSQSLMKVIQAYREADEGIIGAASRG